MLTPHPHRLPALLSHLGATPIPATHQPPELPSLCSQLWRLLGPHCPLGPVLDMQAGNELAPDGGVGTGLQEGQERASPARDRGNGGPGGRGVGAGAGLMGHEGSMRAWEPGALSQPQRGFLWAGCWDAIFPGEFEQCFTHALQPHAHSKFGAAPRWTRCPWRGLAQAQHPQGSWPLQGHPNMP